MWLRLAISCQSGWSLGRRGGDCRLLGRCALVRGRWCGCLRSGMRMLSHEVEGIRKCEHRVECQHGGGFWAPTTQSVDNVTQCTLKREHLCLCRPLLILTVLCRMPHIHAIIRHVQDHYFLTCPSGVLTCRGLSLIIAGKHTWPIGLRIP